MSTKQGGALDTKQSFKGTLRQLQDKVKRDPPGYKDDVMMQLRHFESKVKLFELAPTGASKELCELISFLSHVIPLYKQEGQMFPKSLLEMLEKHNEVLNKEVRKAMVQGLCLLRARNYIEPKQVLPLYFRLFKVKDRELRKLLLSHIVGDVKKMNAKVKNPAVNKQLQNYMYQVMQEDDPVMGRHALWVILDLYRRRVWTDDRVVNVISKACFSKHTKVLTLALRFFMGNFPKDMEEDDDDSDEDEPTAPKKGRNYAKKTKARATAKEKQKSKVEKWERKKESQINSLFKPIEVLNDPQGLAERLLTQLQKTKERFNVRMLHMGVISALINVHKLIVLNFYPYLQRYMEPHQQHVTHIMAWAAQAVHSLVPPENIHSLMMTIANHFVSDRATPDAITVGINTLREICRRQPLVMTEDLLQDIAQYKRFKRDKGVVMASRSLIQLFRELQPEMLARRDRGRDADTDKKMAMFGAPETHTDIDGLELLEEYYQKKQEEAPGAAQAADEWSAEEEEDKSSSDSGSWVSVSQSASEQGEGGEDLEGSDEGEWEEVEEDEEEEEEEEEGEDEDAMVVTDTTPGEHAGSREQLANKAEEGKIQLGGGKLAETKFLTPRDYQLIERLKAQKAEELATGKRKRGRTNMEEEDITAGTIESWTNKKRRSDAETRYAETERLRESHKAKTKLQKKSGGTTNEQKKKKHKLATMVRQSQNVRTRRYETSKDRKARMKVTAKRNLKFKYKKGGH